MSQSERNMHDRVTTFLGKAMNNPDIEFRAPENFPEGLTPTVKAEFEKISKNEYQQGVAYMGEAREWLEKESQEVYI